MNNFGDAFFSMFILMQFLAFCMYGAVIARALHTYTAVIRESLEERRHQRQIELMEMKQKLEAIHHGQIVAATGPHPDGPVDSPVVGEAASEPPVEDVS